MKQSLFKVFALAGAVVFGAVVSTGHSVLAADSKAGAELPLKELRTFAEIFGRIKSDYVEEVEDKVLL